MGIDLSYYFRVGTLAVLALSAADAAGPVVQVREGAVDIPTYEFSARETQPALFHSSSIRGQYPFVPFVRPFRSEKPVSRSYKAVFVENEYLKLTYLPEFGGRFFSLYDKVRGREVFYRNDVIKPAGYNVKDSFPLFGIELTGPWDTHALALNGEPFWSHKVVRRADGAVSLVLGSVDPVYGMKVNLSATLHPGIAAMEMNVFCYNRRDGRMPQMFWISGALQATEKTRFIYPMTRTIGHTTSEIADWPLYNGIDYSWDRNNKHMLGVFGIDIYDNFQGAYMFDRDYGVFRYADRRIVQGMKLWTFGYSPSATNLEHAYTDGAGPYIEVQSGRHVWDGHYEWVGPHKVENWGEWWVPVAGIGGLTTLTRDVALNLAAEGGKVTVGLSPTRVVNSARITVSAQAGEILKATADLAPGKPFQRTVAAAGDLKNLTVRVTDAAGNELLNYRRPDQNPGRQEYTPFTRPLEKPQKTPDQMSAEELVLAAEFKFKELNDAAGNDLLEKALARDAGFSRAHLLAGIQDFNAGRYARAAERLEKAIERDPYLDEAYYYLAMSQFSLGQEKAAERNLYYIWPHSAYYGTREYHLGRLAYLREDLAGAAARLDRAIVANGYDLEARLLLALVYRDQGRKEEAVKQLAEIERIDPTNRPALAERFFLSGDQAARAELVRFAGGQSQEAIDLSIFYRRYRRWGEAVEMLRLAERDNHDVWGTPPEYWYTLAWCLKQKGEDGAQYLAKARASAGRVDRFPYREESEAPLAAAVEADPKDAVARFQLACLLYHHGRAAEAIRQWEAAIETAPADFASRRALGMAYSEQGYAVERAAAQLEEALKIQPSHIPTFNDLSTLYARAGRFEEQLALLQRALARSPGDDTIAEGILAANVISGRYGEAEKLIASHQFAPRHRTYGLRDKYRFLRYGMAGAAFRKGDYAAAQKWLESASKPPVSLGIDDFQFESNPRLNYYLGCALDALGRAGDAKAAWGRAIQGFEQLSGDRDSWNSENFHMVLALDRLGRKEEAARLAGHFEEFARTELEAKTPYRRAEASYLLGLVRKRQGDAAGSRKLFEETVKTRPDFLPARLELRGETL